MAKKNRKPEVEKAPETNETIVFDNDQTLFESEAYGSPQPEAGSDVTVMKTVGIGGPVPIVAPKHNTIQLQPIVVPLAVVPYMTQDSSVLRTDGKQQGYTEEYAEATDFSAAQAEKSTKAKKGVRPRLCVLVTLLLVAALLSPFIIAIFKGSLGSLHFDGSDRFNVINIIKGWISKTPDGGLTRNIIFVATFGVVGIFMLIEAIAFLAGKYPRAFSILFSFIPVGTSLAVIILDIVTKSFVVKDRISIIVFLAVAALNLLMAIIFTAILNSADDKADRAKGTSEI